MYHKWPYVPLVIHPFRYFPHSWLITGFVTRLTWRMPLVEQELLTLPEHLSSPSLPDISGVRVPRSLVLCACFVDRSFSFCIFSFGHFVVCPSIYYFWLPIGYLQTLHMQELCPLLGVYVYLLFVLKCLEVLCFSLISTTHFWILLIVTHVFAILNTDFVFSLFTENLFP